MGTKSKRKFWICQSALFYMFWICLFAIFKDYNLPSAFWIAFPTIPSLFFGANAVGDHQAFNGLFNKNTNTKVE